MILKSGVTNVICGVNCQCPCEEASGEVREERDP